MRRKPFRVPEVVVPSTGGQRWWEKMRFSQARSYSSAFPNNLDRRKIELAGMGGRSGEDLKGDLGD